MLLLIINGRNALAQFHQEPTRTFFGLEVSGGSRSFAIKSNIAELDQLKVAEEGYTAGVSVGTESVIARTSFGAFKSSSLVREKVFLTEKKVGFDIFPLKIAGVKSSFFKPYILTNFDFSTLKFYGSYELPEVLMPVQQGHSDCPEAGGPPNPDEGIVEEEFTEIETPSGEEELLGKMNVTRFNAGAGINVHVPGKAHFLNFFGEVSYGFVLGKKAFMSEFDQTSISRQLSVNVGLSFGFKGFY
jgi:hypothetical protein